MKELKFKAKYDGKTVGYLRWKPPGEWKARRAKKDSLWCDAQLRDDAAIDDTFEEIFFYDELCRFVCLDRNGQDVYEGDKVKEVHLGEASIGWSPIGPRYALICHQYGYRTEHWFDSKDIELIPEDA